MAIIYTTGSNPTGTNRSDIIIAAGGGNDVINARSGNDVIYGDHERSTIDTSSSNNSRATALSLGRFSQIDNPDVADPNSVPYRSIFAQGIGNVDWFSFEGVAGDTITLDIDYGDSSDDLGGRSFDALVRLYESDGSFIIGSDDSSVSDGALGSSSVQDSFLSYTLTSTETFYIRVSDSNNTAIGLGDTYVLNVSNPSADTYGTIGGDFQGNDVINAGNGNDRAYGLGGDDEINGGRGDDTLYGGGGDDTIDGESDNDIIIGGNGRDDLEGGGGIDTITGGLDDDRIGGGSGNDMINGGSGNDAISGDSGNDMISGGSGNDTISGDSGNDTIDGGFGGDTITGGFGADVINGSNGSDIVFGGAGLDELYGDAGDDELRGGNANDELHGGDGNDELHGEGARDTLFGDAGEDQLFGGLNNDIVSGGGDDDQLFGERGSDILNGDGGSDFLNGGAGNDQLFGGDAADTLFGSQGEDRLYGGAGADTFQFKFNSGTDRIFDWEDGLDLIEYDLGGVSGFGGLTISTIAVGVRISSASGEIIVVDNTLTASDFTADDFIF